MAGDAGLYTEIEAGYIVTNTFTFTGTDAASGIASCQKLHGRHRCDVNNRVARPAP
jgi:hypothetical protein